MLSFFLETMDLNGSLSLIIVLLKEQFGTIMVAIGSAIHR